MTQAIVTVHMEVISHRIRGEKRKAWSLHKGWNQEEVLDKPLSYFMERSLLSKGSLQGVF